MENIARFLRDLKYAARSLARERALSVAVILTLALGIGANAASFTLLRGVLLRPLVNRDESRLIYIRQSSNGRNATFSIPEIQDLSSSLTTLNSFGDFSVIGFTLVGLGEPRTVSAGVVSGSYFDVMGLHPVLGRLLDVRDDGPNAAGAVVLTYRFWSTALNRDTSIIDKTIKLGSFVDSRSATIVGVLEPSVPYPQDTEIIANIVTSSHHLSATMVTARTHRMTELFARLRPGTDLKTARAELESAYTRMLRQHPEAYPPGTDFRVSAVPLRDELTSGARTILLVLMAASVLVFVIAASNVANLILARSVRRENELAIRAALGASVMDLRRILFAEGFVLCLAGAIVGIALARPIVAVLARYASRYSIRALDLTVDTSMLWVGAALALLAALLLAFIPRLRSLRGGQAFGLAGGPRPAGTTNRKLKVFGLVQVAASFVLVAAAAAAVNTLLSLASIRSRFDTHVLAINVPVVRGHRTTSQIVDYDREAMRQIHDLPGVINVSLTSQVPWRDRGDFMMEFSPDGHVPAAGEKHPRATYQSVSPGFFTSLGLPVLEGRDFTDADRDGAEPVAIVSETLAREIFPNGDALNHQVKWTDPVLQFAPGMRIESRRIVGIVPDIDNRNLAARPHMTIYHPFGQEPMLLPSRLVVQAHAQSDPYALVQPVTRILRSLSAEQPVERGSTLEDIRAEVLSPEKLNAMVSGIFALVALLVAVVGVAGVLSFSVSGRMREFGIRLAVGSRPRDLLMRVVGEGALMAMGGLVLGLLCGLVMAQLAGTVIGNLKMPGVTPLIASALVLLLSAVAASAIPAARAARVDVMTVLRND